MEKKEWPTWWGWFHLPLHKNIPGFLKKMVMFLRNITIFFENIKVFFAAWECVKTKPCYPIVSCRGEVHSPENSLLCVFGQANPAPRNETTALSTFWHIPLFVKCVRTHRTTHTVASGHTYIRIELHVRTHEPARIYVIVSGSVISDSLRLSCNSWGINIC